MEPFDERVFMELFSKRFSDVFFCNGRMNVFDDNFFIVPVRKEVSCNECQERCVVFISCSKISVSFSESV